MRLHGRLGNNLWQFASGLGIATALDARLCFDSRAMPAQLRLLQELIPSTYEEATPDELRRVGVGPLRVGSRASVERWALRQGSNLERRLRHRKPARISLYDPADTFDDERFELDLPAYIGGYFGDERIFEAVADQVAEAIRWPASSAALPDDLGTTVAVSFRRGDYNLFEAGLPVDFYDRAMQEIADRVAEPTFVLFGDDPAFVGLFAEHAARLGYSVVSALQFGHDPITQLRMQSECHHAIVANSTFAWWGAWLGDRRGEPGRTVIAPAGTGRLVRVGWTALEELPGKPVTYDLANQRRSSAMS